MAVIKEQSEASSSDSSMDGSRPIPLRALKTKQIHYADKAIDHEELKSISEKS